MFTGIIEEVGTLRHMTTGRITIACHRVLEDVHIGDSIAVNGICLTVTAFETGQFTADVMPETVHRTSLSEVKLGSAVNLERALMPTSRMGGHIVSGHIDGTGRIHAMEREGNALLLTISAPPEILRYIVEKGSVALDGISLTVVSVAEQNFMVSMIPHTREATNLREKRKGSRINIETDILGKYVERMLLGKGSKPSEENAHRELTRAFLLENGY